jgi:hypothetical protein
MYICTYKMYTHICPSRHKELVQNVTVSGGWDGVVAVGGGGGGGMHGTTHGTPEQEWGIDERENERKRETYTYKHDTIDHSEV